MEEFLDSFDQKSFEEASKVEKKFYDVQTKATSINAKDRTVEFIATKEVVDRTGDIVRVNGVDVKNFLQNPVVPFGHNYNELPVAKVSGIRVEGDELITRLQFPEEGIHDMSDKVFKFIQLGMINAVSIGFIPLKQMWDDSLETPANVIEKSELLEVSIVPVPANQAAVIKSLFDVEEEKVTIKDIEEASKALKELPIEEIPGYEDLEETIAEQKTIIKAYRKMQVQVRDILNVEADADEMTTLKDIVNAVKCITSLIEIKTQSKQTSEDALLKELLSLNDSEVNSDENANILENLL